jgi:acyl carrier protein
MNQEQIARRLQEILGRIMATDIDEPRQVDIQATFADLGINSVDLLEFVLGLEDGFGVRVLDDMLPNDLPATLAGWATLVQAKITRKAAA